MILISFSHPLVNQKGTLPRSDLQKNIESDNISNNEVDTDMHAMKLPRIETSNLDENNFDINQR